MNKYLSVSLNQIKHILAVSFREKHCFKAKKGNCGKSLSHRSVNLITAFADAGTDCGNYIFGKTTVIVYHFFDGLFTDKLRRTAPACVRGGYYAFYGVAEQKGSTVGVLSYKRNTLTVGYKTVNIIKGLFENSRTPVTFRDGLKQDYLCQYPPLCKVFYNFL